MKFTLASDCTLFDLLVQQFPATPATRIKKWIRLGAASMNREVLYKPDLVLPSGAVVEFQRPKLQFAPLAPELPFEVVFEDEFLIAVVKPAGLLSIRAGEEKENSLYGILLELVRDASRGKSTIHVVHRLDKEVSGIILFAKDMNTKELLVENWSMNEKTYAALVEGVPRNPEGRIENWLMEGPGMKVIPAPEGVGKKAISDYRVIRTIGHHSLVEVKLVTGRKNQLRAHLSGIGCPIAGDRRYGSRDKYKRQVRLFARRLVFNHPITGMKTTLEAPLPKNFLKLYPFHET